MDQTAFEPLHFPAADIIQADHFYLVRLARPLQFLSSGLIGEGLTMARWILSLQVGAKATLPDPEGCLRQRGRELGIPEGEPLVGLLTAVAHRDLQIHSAEEANVGVLTLATVGVDHGSSPLTKRISSYGNSPIGTPDVPLSVGTINTLVLVNADLGPSALVRASTVATEAKTLAIMESGRKTRDGHITTGTPTDVTVVGHSGCGVGFKYAGLATLVGWLVGHSVYTTVKQGLAAYDARKSNLPGSNGPPETEA